MSSRSTNRSNTARPGVARLRASLWTLFAAAACAVLASSSGTTWLRADEEDEAEGAVLLAPDHPPDGVAIPAERDSKAKVSVPMPGEARTALERRLKELGERLDKERDEYEALRKDLGLDKDEKKDGDRNGAAKEDAKKDDKKKDEKPKEDPLAMSAKWNHGLELQSKDKKFRVHVGGRVQTDAIWLNAHGNALDGSLPNSFPPSFLTGQGDNDSVNIRRARLRIDGTMYETIDWATEFDFSNEANDNPGVAGAAGVPSEQNGTIIPVTAPTDLWVTFKEIPLIGNIRAGIFKEPVGMEHLTSSRFLPFMERSFMQDAFYGPFNNGFGPGIMAFNAVHDDRATWSAAFMKNTTNIFGYGFGEGEYLVAGRVTALPWYEHEGARLMHVGVSGSHRNANDEFVRVRARGSLRNGPPSPFNPIYADTSNLIADAQNLLGGEFAMNLDSLTIQAEYTGSWIENASINLGNNLVPTPFIPQGTVFVRGYYVQALYFLTGEHMEYERKQGVFGRVIPRDPLRWKLKKDDCNDYRRWGAWQLAARYGNLNLNDSGVHGGSIQDVTLGLNWYMNPNMKVQGNYVITHRDAQNVIAGGVVNTGIEGGVITGFGMRLAYDF